MNKLIYIMGCANCGSTLLTTLLGRHSAIATVGELKGTAIADITAYQCGCGQRLLECGFWRDVQVACKQGGFPLDLADFQVHYSGGGWLQDHLLRTPIRTPWFERVRALGLHLWPPARAALHRLHRRNKTIMNSVCEKEGKSVFLDGSKDPVRLLHFVRSGLFDVRAVHLVRDGRAIVASYKKRSSDTSRNLALWKSKAIECERAKAVLTEAQVFTLRYEDLCRDVRGTLQTLFRFFEVADESESCQKDCIGASSHILGHNSRLSGSREVRLRDEWSALLSEQEIRLFESCENGLNSLYGYGTSAKVATE